MTDTLADKMEMCRLEPERVCVREREQERERARERARMRETRSERHETACTFEQEREKSREN